LCRLAHRSGHSLPKGHMQPHIQAQTICVAAPRNSLSYLASGQSGGHSEPAGKPSYCSTVCQRRGTGQSRRELPLVSLFAWRSIDTKSPLLEWMYPPLDATQFESRKYCSSGFSSLLSISELI